MTLFKTKVIAPPPGGNTFAPMGVVEAGFHSAYLMTDEEVDSFRIRCVEEIERMCQLLKENMRSANERLDRDLLERGNVRTN